MRATVRRQRRTTMKESSLWLGPPVRFSKRARSQVTASSLSPSPLEQAGAVQLASSLFAHGLYSRQLPFLIHSFTHQPAFAEHLLYITHWTYIIWFNPHNQHGKTEPREPKGLGTCPASHSRTRIWTWLIWLQSLFTSMLSPFVVWWETWGDKANTRFWCDPYTAYLPSDSTPDEGGSLS